MDNMFLENSSHKKWGFIFPKYHNIWYLKQIH